MLRFISFISLIIFTATKLYAAQSVILDTEGYACMGDDKSRKQTEDFAFKDAKRKATESAATYIRSETHVKDAMLEKDLMSAYSNAQVKVIQELIKNWYKDAGSGDCFKVSLKVEVLPDEMTMSVLAKKNQDVLESDPAGPLNVKIWTDRKDYRQGEKMRVFMKGNKPFYARLIYREASGTLVQILPNPFRITNYFNGGTVYEVPGGDDKFDLEVSSPFGAESITLSASTHQLGDLDLIANGAVYSVQTIGKDIASKTRGVKIIKKDSSITYQGVAEFAENIVELKTSGQ